MAVTIGARVTVPGLHNWPDAHGDRSYLRCAHRHLFHIDVEARVGHDERDVEFHDLAHLVDTEARRLGHDTDTGLVDYGARSCETLARQLAVALAPIVNVATVRWSEDGEFWATITTGEDQDQ
ncbi:hypothetical protein CLV30_12841 [Haloactinopolyspora alba]|uniref:6-carboxy-5,6,7,8-tetrahydropterin synthase n=1 Tax=Haloactinopolyspora alba TaxID=648780 RepID=A0A2P8DF08_9ACTN|nr:hypothetical protein [Haloactinopolyspora alba]PSK95789.1 hypothetical protein CLV30_12841 [Haloactinopolyspora alba]